MQQKSRDWCCWLVVTLGCGLSSMPAGIAEADMVFEGRPTIRATANADSATRELLSDLDQEKNRITIFWQDGRYVWATRDAHEMVLNAGGATFLFADPTGTGYVKILDTHAIPGSERTSPRYRFMEHVHVLQSTITYWGACDDCFRPWVGD